MDTATRTTPPALTSRHYGAVNWVGLQTLVWREIRRFLKVGAQTVFAPLIQTLLFMLVFSLVRQGDWPGTTRAYAYDHANHLTLALRPNGESVSKILFGA